MKTTAAILSLLAIAVTACGSPGDTPPAVSQTSDDTTPAEPSPAPPSALATHMNRHSEQFEALNDALAAGDLDAVAAPAWWLARHEPSSELVPDWQDHLAAMREAASDAEAATDLATARAAVERLSQTCNGCHTDADVDKSIYPVDPG